MIPTATRNTPAVKQIININAPSSKKKKEVWGKEGLFQGAYILARTGQLLMLELMFSAQHSCV
jgi:hypothetical protein